MIGPTIAALCVGIVLGAVVGLVIGFALIGVGVIR